MDVGSRVLKAVTLQPGHTSPILKGIVFESLPFTPNPNSQTDLEDDRQLVQFLRRQLSPFPRAVGITVSSPHVLLKRLALPYMSEKDLREHLALELDRYIPLDVQGAVWDVYRHKDSDALDNEKVQTFLVVAKKEFIEARMRQFEGQGMHVHFVDVDAFSLVNMVAYNYGHDGTWMIIHLGPTGILSVMMEKGRLVHMHQVSYEVEWYGDLLDRVQAAAWADDGLKLGASETLLLEQFFKETIQQVIESIKYASEGTDMGVVQGVMLSGGYSMLEGLQSRLADSLHVSVTLVDPFKKIKVPQEMQQDSCFQKALPLFGVAVGAALRGAIPHD
ncbi:pilus assembly protein PilM [Candidatus Nitrospira neomarina]|uniref:Pilus assembly protein PilM n=1 Tax=Candidatus Nitrospira neomarina TaxID=3020899 RepID=A0AA96K022_9BACT|nr:pilus assembly protein PilM [Candidatus Nitrospira neomarina]WNM61681.1 pilus assembly protein PilM [Candidatus Nitrospira neomarina]